MNDTIICKPSPVKVLSISRAPLVELLNFLIYSRHFELLNERARRQPYICLERIPSSVGELRDFLGAEKCDKNKKLFLDCERSENQAAVLLGNQGAQFWIYYFRSGVGLVNLSFFSHLASAEGSLLNRTRSVTHSSQYQWFAHDLASSFFVGEFSEARIEQLGSYFVRRVNSTLISPYSIRFENPLIAEPYKFVSGSLERLKEVLTWARFVCEALKRERDPNGKTWVSPHATINCGNLKDAPTFERSTETFMNVVGALAVKENSPYTVLREGFGRRAGGECFDWERKNKHRIFINLEQENGESPVRLKIAARARLADWLTGQGSEGERLLKAWKVFG